MKYEEIIAQIAKKHNISKKEVDLEIKTALVNSGIYLSPEVFIELATELIKKTIYNK